MRPVKLFLILALVLAPATSSATVTYTYEGTTPDTLVDFSFQADLTITGDDLEIVLSNNSASLNPSSPTMNPNDLLTSFYFEIAGAAIGTLSYVSATGDVYLGDKDIVDTLDTAAADLVATQAGDNTWAFRDDMTLQFGADVLRFGIGTAGNNSLSPNGFNGSIVDGLDYGIFSGEITTQNLDGKLLVKDTATFNFSGLTGFTEDDLSAEALFGLGTQPDSTALVPEPSTALLLGLGLSGLALRRSRVE